MIEDILEIQEDQDTLLTQKLSGEGGLGCFIHLEDKKVMFHEGDDDVDFFSGFGLFQLKTVFEEVCFYLILNIFKEEGARLEEGAEQTCEASVRDLCSRIVSNLEEEPEDLTPEEHTYILFYLGSLKNAFFKVGVTSKLEGSSSTREQLLNRIMTRTDIEQVATTIKELFKKTISFFGRATRGHSSVKDKILVELIQKFPEIVEDEGISQLQREREGVSNFDEDGKLVVKRKYEEFLKTDEKIKGLLREKFSSLQSQPDWIALKKRMWETYLLPSLEVMHIDTHLSKSISVKESIE